MRRSCWAASASTATRSTRRVGDLSGGETSRAALARLVAQGVNVLVLDEPTNHLDMWACDALEQALLEFEGTAIVVSHDRYFLNRVVDLLIVLEGEAVARSSTATTTPTSYCAWSRNPLPSRARRAPR